MLKNKQIGFLVFNFFLTCFVISEIHANDLKSDYQQEAELAIVLEDLTEKTETFVQSSNQIKKAWSKFLTSASKVKNTWYKINKDSDVHNKDNKNYEITSDEAIDALDASQESWSNHYKYSEKSTKFWSLYKDKAHYNKDDKDWLEYVQAEFKSDKYRLQNIKEWNAYIQATKKLNSKNTFSSEKVRNNSAQTFFNALHMTLITQKELTRSKIELWAKYIQLFDVLSKSLDLPANIFNLKETQKFLKHCLKHSQKLGSKSDKIKNDLKVLNNKNINLDEKMMENNANVQSSNEVLIGREKSWSNYQKSLVAYEKEWIQYVNEWGKFEKNWDEYVKSSNEYKKVSIKNNAVIAEHEKNNEKMIKDKVKYLEAVDKHSKSWNKVTTDLKEVTKSKNEVKTLENKVETERDKILDDLNDFFQEIEKLDKLEKKLKNGLLLETQTMFKNAIQSLKNEPKAQKIYRQSLIAYKAIEEAYELIN